MSAGGRGRGYTGRHSRARPGDRADDDAASPRATDREQREPERDMPRGDMPRADIPRDMSRGDMPRADIPRDMSRGDMPRADIPRDMSRGDMPRADIPRDMSRGDMPRADIPRDMSRGDMPWGDIPRDLPKGDMPRGDIPRDRKLSQQERDIPEPDTVDLLDNISSEDDAVLKELLNIDEQYQPLLQLLEQFLPSEDGIQFNRKLRNFETTITNLCPDESRLQAAFGTFRAAALRNPVTARKLAGVGASFTRQQRQQLLRTTLLNVIMQGTFSKLDILERANPLFLINAANLMGDYFSEARLCNGNKVHILASPLLQYMKALLSSDDVRAHRSLATQLMQNGRELLAVQQTETEELTIKIRLRLLTPPPCGIVWLLLSSDMALNKFLPLPNCLQQFYASNLKLTSDSDYSEVTYGSWKKSEDNDDCNLSQNLSNVSLTDEDTSSKPKLRPILGAGAGLLRQGPSSQDFDWTPKVNLAKRYDLNSWREQEKDEPVFDPCVPPPIANIPPIPNIPKNFSEYPPPNFNFQDYNNYLQQGDGHYIQNFYEYQPEEKKVPDQPLPDYSYEERYFDENYQYQEEIPERATMADFEDRVIPDDDRATNADFEDRTVAPDNDKVTDKVNNEIQNCSRKPVDNWRRDKCEDEKWSREEKWTRNEEEEKTSGKNRLSGRLNRRNSSEPEKSPTRRHVSDVPRNHKYWDHDDRCDKEY